MKKIEAVIRPERLEDVMAALEEVGYPGLMLTRIEGHGKQKGVVQHIRGRQYKVELLPKYKVEVVCDDEESQRILDAIVGAARTGDVGDGKVFLSTIDDVIRVRTAENGIAAL